MKINAIIQILFLSIFFSNVFADTITKPIRTFAGHTGGICIDDCVTFSPDGQFILSGSYDNTIKLWEVSTGQEIRTFVGHSHYVNAIALSPDSQFVLSGSADQTLKLWELATGQVNGSVKEQSIYVYSVTFSPNGQFALSGSAAQTLKLWDVSTGQAIRSFDGHSKDVASVALSPDGQLALSGSWDGTIKLWEVSTGLEIRSFEDHSDWVNSVAFSPDGQFALSGSTDNTLKLWEIATGLAIRSFDGHAGAVYSVAFAPDGKFALSGSADNTLKLWEIATGLELRSFEGHSKDVQSIAFSPDGQFALSGSEDGTLKLWETGLVNKPPTAAFTVSPTHGEAPLTINLDATDSTDPDGTITQYHWSASDGQTTSGQKVTMTFENAGTYTINLVVTDEKGAQSTHVQETVIVDELVHEIEPIPGQAIIIAGPEPKDGLFKYSNEFTQRMYRLLKQRGYNDDKIHYLNVLAPDIEKPLDGRPEAERQDYALFDPEAELADAFAQATAKLSVGEQFVFYLHAHAHPDAAYLVDYELTASHLRDLLTSVPAGVQQIIILDTCYSGSFIDDLKEVANRVVVTSTNDKSLTWQIASSSFANKFMKMLEHGASLLEAFQAAEDMILNARDLFAGQRPWLDDDGDGKFLNDGLRSKYIYVGRRKIEHAAPPPKITKVHPPITLPKNTTTATLWVHTQPNFQFIHQVRAVLINPNYQVSDYQGKNTDFSREEIELIYNAAQERYEVAYNDFWTAGTWWIHYQAQDVDGVWSEIVKGEVQAAGCGTSCVNMELNQSRFTTGDPLRLDMTVNSKEAVVVDLYVAIVFPDGDFITIAYPLNFSWPNAAQVYQPNVDIAGQKTYPIMNFPMPDNIALGQYSACGVLVKAGAAPLDQSHWIHIDCAEFEVY
jgi:WD40 repeat protein